MYLTTERLIITRFAPEMAEDVHRNSLEEDVRRFVPDEVFDTVEAARETLAFLISRYGGKDGPFVYPVLTKAGENVGYVQLVPLAYGWEVGYHIAQAHTGRGYAAEAVRAFLPVIMTRMELAQVWGICDAENVASRRVLEKCGFVLQNMFTRADGRNICRYMRERG